VNTTPHKHAAVIQTWLNARGAGLEENGIFDDPTRAAMAAALQQETGWDSAWQRHVEVMQRMSVLVGFQM
jgi:hypothetical protein